MIAATDKKVSRVRVGVRVRPLTSRETSEGGKVVVDANTFERTVGISKRRFTYDSVFHHAASNVDLYNNVAPPLIQSVMNGYNATVLAYGQTGSGKTYTMGSEAHVEDLKSGNLHDHVGLIPRFMTDIFETLFERKNESEKAMLRTPEKMVTADGPLLIDFKVSASFLEVYGEDIFDLLDEDRSSLKLREDTNGEVVVVGLSSVPIGDAAEASAVLKNGTMNRTTAATLMNSTSSRSHAVLTVTLQQTTRSLDCVDFTTTSRITFVDLAGSERMKKTGAEGERMKEGIKINEGLLALGNVINALGDEERLAKGEKVHVPYRQSKLTRLLQDALGGNSQTLFLACVSPSDTNASETISTLQYANRARNIRNSPTRNIDANSLEIKRLRVLNNVLKCELIKHRFDPNITFSPNPENERLFETLTFSNNLGEVDEALFQRKDVLSYLRLIDDKVLQLSDFSPQTANFSAMTPESSTTLTPSTQDLSSSTSPMNGSEINSCDERGDTSQVTRTISSAESFNHNYFDDITDTDINLSYDLAVIDELIERERLDRNFELEQRENEENILRIEGDIQEQEERLLQLRGHLQIYHNMKEKYESLLQEVHNLESEKQMLLDKLERAKVDPTKGCSISIKKQLDEVKQNLARARTETRKHQQLYRQAEQEAKKCHVLERKIEEMKIAKVNLIKKQKDDDAKKRDRCNKKTEEIKHLRHREKASEKKISQLENECQRYKTILERSQSRYDKLLEKLQQTESTLTRLLTKRRHDLNRNNNASRRCKTPSTDPQDENVESNDSFAPYSEEVKSIEFVLDKTVSDWVTQALMKKEYRLKTFEHENLMKEMSNEVKILNQKKRQSREMESEPTDELLLQVQQHEDNVQGYLIQIELIEDEIEKLCSKLPSTQNDIFNDKEEDQTIQHRKSTIIMMLSRLDESVLRTLLWKILQSYFQSEYERHTMRDMIAKKESALNSYENEMLAQNTTINALSNDLRKSRVFII